MLDLCHGKITEKWIGGEKAGLEDVWSVIGEG